MRKRILIVGVFTLLCILLIGCSAGKGSETTSVTSETLKITENPAIDPTPSPSPKPMPSSWKIDNYVDDFGDKTGSAYLRGEFKGKRSDSFSSNEDLTVYVYYDEVFAIRLIKEYKYVSSSKASFSSLSDIEIKIKIDGKEYSLNPKIIRDSDDIYISNEGDGFIALKDALMEGKEIRFVIKEHLLSDVFQFTIDGIGFKETLENANMN
jgi:hypothetical protein